MPPVTPAQWHLEGTRIASTPGPACPQKLPDLSNESEALKSMTKGRFNRLKRMLPSLRNQSEDCLYLNIFTPLNGKIVTFFLSFPSLGLSFFYYYYCYYYSFRRAHSSWLFFFSRSTRLLIASSAIYASWWCHKSPLKTFESSSSSFDTIDLWDAYTHSLSDSLLIWHWSYSTVKTM